MYNWKPVIKSLVVHLQKDGFVLHSVDNGGDIEEIDDINYGIDEICATDESSVWFKHENEDRLLWAFIVLGNEPFETVCDYTARDSEVGHFFDQSISAWSESWEDKPCPRK